MPHSKTTTRNRTQWLLLSFILLAFATLMAVNLYHERERLLQEQREQLLTMARVVNENIIRQLEGVRNGLQSILQDLDYFDDFKEHSSLLNLRLQALYGAMPGVRTLNVLDAKGYVLASNREQLLGSNFSERDYFSMVMQAPDTDVLYLSQPFETVLDVYSMNLLQVSTNEQGEVDRIVSATLDPDFFRVLLSSVRYDDDVWVALAHIDGVMVLRFPAHPGLPGTDLLQPDGLFSRHIESGAPTSFLKGEVIGSTGEQAWMAQHTITAPELQMRGAMVVAVARNPQSALKHWRQMTQTAAGIVTLISLIAAVALWRSQRSREQAEEILAHEETLRRQAEDEIRQMAFHDHLTQLPNRRLLFDRMNQLLSASVRHGRYSALLFLDLDGFKGLNDGHGHDRGDRLLKEVAKRLQGSIRQEDTVARWAGDEFIVMLSELSSDAEEAKRRASAVAEKILAGLAQDYDLDGLTYRCTASLGMTLFGRGKEPLDDIIKRADHLMYQAKASGRNTFRGDHSA